MNTVKKLGILAGSGILPALAAREALKQGWPVTIYAVAEENFQSDPDLAPYIQPVTITRFGSFLKRLKREGITNLILLGKIRKEHLFRELRFDMKTVWLLSKMLNKNDDTIFYTVENEMKKIGVTLLPQAQFLEPLLLNEGIYSKKKPSKAILKDIEFGMFYARSIGALDIGQTVVVKDGSVLAVEAIEGTDKCIMRGGELSRKKGAIVCKAEKLKQDIRFDIPTVGVETLEVMKKSGCSVLAIEAGKTFVVTPKEVFDYVNRNHMILVSTHVPDKF